MTGRVADEIAALRDLDQDGLRRRWRMLSGKPAPLHLPRALLVRLIAYSQTFFIVSWCESFFPLGISISRARA